MAAKRAETRTTHLATVAEVQHIQLRHQRQQRRQTLVWADLETAGQTQRPQPGCRLSEPSDCWPPVAWGGRMR